MAIPSIQNEFENRSPERNRLTIAHLLLWMTTTGVFLAWHQSQRPPSLEDVDYAGSISASNEQEWEARYAQEQRRLWRRLNAQHWAGLIASPFTGIVMSATLWSCYELLSRRFRFPTQPGHWVLLTIAVVLAIQWIRSWLRPIVDRGLDEFIPTVTGCVLFAGIAVKNWSYARWTLAFALLSVACGAIGLANLMGALDTPLVSLLILGMLMVASFPVAVLICCLVDLSQRRSFDIFHWIGIGTLGGFVVCFGAWFAQFRSIS